MTSVVQAMTMPFLDLAMCVEHRETIAGTNAGWIWNGLSWFSWGCKWRWMECRRSRVRVKRGSENDMNSSEVENRRDRDTRLDKEGQRAEHQRQDTGACRKCQSCGHIRTPVKVFGLAAFPRQETEPKQSCKMEKSNFRWFWLQQTRQLEGRGGNMGVTKTGSIV